MPRREQVYLDTDDRYEVTAPDRVTVKVINLGPDPCYYSTVKPIPPAMASEGTLPVGGALSFLPTRWFFSTGKSSLHVITPTVIEQLQDDLDAIAAVPGPGPGTVSELGAVTGDPDRFYKEAGGVLTYNGSGFVLNNDSFSRAQNIELATTDAQKITLTHADIDAVHVVEAHATVNENRATVGISAVVRPQTDHSEIVLRQNRRLADTLVNSGGTSWVKELAEASPFTVDGLTNASSDFVATINGLANLASYYRLSESSGTVLDDATAGSHDGAVVGSGTTYGVTGGMQSDGADKAISTTGVSPNELTFPITGTGITQAAFSVIWRGRGDPGILTAFRDNTSITGTGYCVMSNQLSDPRILYRAGSSAATYTTSTPWSKLTDGGFHTIVMTKNGATVALYLDGVLIHTASTGSSVALEHPWHLGRSGALTVFYSPVTLSEFATVARALTLTEVQNIHGAASSDGLLHVSHVDMGSTKSSEITLTPHSVLRPVVVPDSVTPTGFAVKFFNSAGTQITTGDANMSFSLIREVRNRIINPKALSVDIVVAPEQAWDPAVRSTSPKLWARLGESSGTSFNDEIGTNDGAGTVTLGAASAIVGDANTGVTLDGAQNKIAFANPALTGSFSISLWFKCTGAGSVGQNDYATLFGWTNGGNIRRIAVHHSDGIVRAETGGAILLTPADVAPVNQLNHIVYTWNGTTQRIIVNGILAATQSTTGISLNAPLWLGSSAATSADWSFKGDFDEFMVWDRAILLAEAQQLYVTGTNKATTVDRALQASIAFRGLFETSGPPPVADPLQPVPLATPLPAGDVGAGVTGNTSILPYRAGLNRPAWMNRPLPTTQVARNAIALNGLPGVPLATSANWKNHFCNMVGIDPITGAVTTATQGGSTPLYLRAASEWIYIVPDSQPLRQMTDFDSTVSGWAQAYNNESIRRGGLPVPHDAMPHFTSDRYAFVYQPSKDLWITLYAMQPLPEERARTTIECTGSPSAGGFFLEFTYMDNSNVTPQTFYTQAPVPYNCTAANLATLLMAAETAAGAALGTIRSGATPVLVSGGPLNVSPLVCEWPLGAPLQPVAMVPSNNFMNSGTVQFTYKNADPWSGSRLSSITTPASEAVTSGHIPINKGSAAATGIDWMPMIVDWEEYTHALAAGTGMGKVLAMSIGNCGTGFVYPAIRSDGTLSNADGSKIRQGALCTFPLDADSSKVSPDFMPMFRTIQEHGFIPIDKTGGGAEFIFRNYGWTGATFPRPVPSTMSLSSANYMTWMRSLPWHQLQIIDPAAVQAGW